MAKKFFIIPLLVLTGIIAPVFFCFAGEYQIQQEAPNTKDLRNCGTATYEGIVPCGKCVDIDDLGSCQISSYTKDATKDVCKETGSGGYQKIYIDCQLCHAFIMLDGILDFVLITIVPLLAVLMLVIGGVMFYLGGTKPELVSKGKSLIKSVVIGLFLVYGAYMIIGSLLTLLGATQFEAVSNIFKDGVFSIKCPILLPLP